MREMPKWRVGAYGKTNEISDEVASFCFCDCLASVFNIQGKKIVKLCQREKLKIYVIIKLWRYRHSVETVVAKFWGCDEIHSRISKVVSSVLMHF